MLNSANSPDIINPSDPVLFPDIVNLHDLVWHSHLIRGFHLIKAFDYIMEDHLGKGILAVRI
ncbi:hypothetical protein EO92_06355 [Methanosarcina sp. 2.H.A.1B.4]|jgi:hypothetical protein|nr:hypothetical protein EO92_06355 [Methanosarcina sp. 2.H.A.1B.4]KKH49833.1 hypothetical protein EO93_17820 [Methanosarcina sp. 1.H.A.2.2]